MASTTTPQQQSELLAAERRLLPPFQSLPLEGAEKVSSLGEEWWLLAQVKENMTITKPTLVVTDWTGRDFAVVFEDAGFSLKAFKKGRTVVIPRARRTEKGEGKQAVVVVPPEECSRVEVMATDLESVFDTGNTNALIRRDRAHLQKACSALGCDKDAAQVPGGLRRCSGCLVAEYCSKECQARDWKVHSSPCKTAQAIRGVWGEVPPFQPIDNFAKILGIA